MTFELLCDSRSPDHADLLAARFSNRPVSSGLLPPNCLFWQQRAGRERIGIFIPPQMWDLRVAPTSAANRRLPLPGLVFVGRETHYQLWAVKEAELTAQTVLYHAPVPNMDRAVCTGNVEFPPAGAATIGRAVKAFFESDFNNHLIQGKSRKYPDNILRMWRVLHRARAKAYPLDDLVETRLILRKVMNDE